MSQHEFAWRRASVCVAALSGIVSSAAATAPVAPPPIEAFFGAETFKSAQISPSGRWVVSLVGGGGLRDRLVLTDLEDKEPTKILAVLTSADIAEFRWVNDDWLTYGVSSQEDRSGKRKSPGLLSISRNGERTRILIKRDYEQSVFDRTLARVLNPDHYYLAPGAPGKNEVVIGHANFDPVNRADVTHITPLALNVESGVTRTLVDRSLPNVFSWIFDHLGRARVAVSWQGGEFVTVYWSNGDASNWSQIGRFPVLAQEFEPAFVDQSDNLFVYRSSGENGEQQLYRFDFKTGKPEAEPWVTVPGFDALVTPVRSPQTGTLQGLRVVGEAESTVWLEPAMQGVQAKIDSLLPGRVNVLECRPCDKPKNILVRSFTDRDPGQYFLYQAGSDQLQRLGRERSTLNPENAARVQFHRLTARDGVQVPVWVTGAPAKGEPMKPTVVLVHGGPWVRGGYWEWEGKAQFLASRGYLVVAPEFRGSDGYGRKLERAGWKQWGQSMQDDVTDALRFAVDKGWADPKRVCIAGASYGGYATLMGLAKDPDQYQCGVAWVAVSDQALMFSTHWSDITSDTKRVSMPTRIGDPVKDASMLTTNSPLAHAKRIKAPVLLAYSAQDKRVPLVHGEKMREALKANGREPEWVVYDGEGHSWQRNETHIDFWKRVEVFLAKHLKATP